MKDFNMAGDPIMDSQIITPTKETKEPYKIGIGSIILSLAFVALIATVLIQDNTNDSLRAKTAEQDTLINHLKTVLSDDLNMHHAKQGK